MKRIDIINESIQNNKEYTKLVIDIMNDYFNDDNKTKIWLGIISPMLNNISPMSMIISGKSQELYKLIMFEYIDNEDLVNEISRI